jgi:hypothetical protein
MPKKSKDQSRERAAPEADTTSYEQSQGAPEKVAPNRRNERMPHERDESARATGNRLTEKPVPSDRQISQAHDDVEDGLVDTDRRGVPNDLPKPK